MPSIDRYVKVTGAFDPETIQILVRAYDLTCALIGRTAPHSRSRSGKLSPRVSSKHGDRGNAIRFVSETLDWRPSSSPMLRILMVMVWEQAARWGASIC
jgi:hypothetical protein